MSRAGPGCVSRGWLLVLGGTLTWWACPSRAVPVSTAPVGVGKAGGWWGGTSFDTLLGPEGMNASVVGWPSGCEVGAGCRRIERPGLRVSVVWVRGGFGGIVRPYFENCTVDASIFIFVAKLVRAHGGCLGIRSR